jgi:hypothetical protein
MNQQERHSKVVGYFAYVSPEEVLCDGDACIISASEAAIRDYQRAASGTNHAADLRVRKTRFGEILAGLAMGASYAFDPTTYDRFRPLALAEGLQFEPERLGVKDPGGFEFFRIQLRGA